MKNVCFLKPGLGASLETHLSPALVILDPRVNAKLTEAFGWRFFAITSDPEEVASWPQVGRTDLPFRIHRERPARIAVLDKPRRNVLFFRDSEWGLDNS